MTETKPTILIVEDDLDIADMLTAYFRVQDYEVLTVNWGEDGIRAAQSNTPDLIILDIRLPDIDGFEVARRLRSNRKTRAIPIIFLTEKRARDDRLKGLELQADDYITKPFDIQELRLRVRNVLQRASQRPLTSPITGLPEGTLLDEALINAIAHRRNMLLVVSLHHIEPFREVYGFVAADDMLRAVALLLRDVVRDYGSAGDFLGQLSPTDFLIITLPENAPALKERVRKQLERSFDFFYSDRHRESDSFEGQMLSVQIGELSLLSSPLNNLSAVKSELERFCKPT